MFAKHPLLRYELRESDDREGGTHVEMYAEGTRISIAHARAEVGPNARELLGEALVDDLERAFARIDLAQCSESSGRWKARYVSRTADDISVGLVWFDPTSDATGPDSVPAIVRAKMRYEAERKLAGKRPGVLRLFVDMLVAMSA
jgi:hypothetical protein